MVEEGTLEEVARIIKEVVEMEDHRSDAGRGMSEVGVWIKKARIIW